MSYKPSSKLFFWYYTSIISIILVVGFFATVWTYKNVSFNTQKDLLINVASVANAFDPDDIISLTGTKSDTSNPYYLSLKNKLEQIRGLNKDIRFIYLWGYRGEQIYFMVDSELTSSLDYSPPGQIYNEATQVERQVFTKELPSAIEFNEDRWGSWLTALVPIMDGEKVYAVLGMDISSSQYNRDVLVYTLVPIISTLFVLFLILIGFVLRKNEEKYLELKEKLISLATHKLRSPLTGISWLIETILNNKKEMDNEQRTNIEDVNKRIKNLLNDVNELLDSNNKKNTKK